MSGLFAFTFTISLLVLPIALIKPSLFSKFGIHTRKKVGTVLGTVAITSFMALGFTTPPVKDDTSVVENTFENNNQRVESVNSDNELEPEIPTNTPSPSEKPKNIPTATLAPTRTSTPTPTVYIKLPTSTPTTIIYVPTIISDHPAGASAICQDGTYSYSQNRRGTCSHHGGVAQWL